MPQLEKDEGNEKIVELYKLNITEAITMKNAGVSFAEIEEYLDRENIPYEGDTYLDHPDFDNVFVWFGNEHFIDAFVELLNEGEIHLRPTVKFTYVLDGKVPKFKTAKRPPEDGYVDLRWAPYAVYMGDGIE